MNTTVTPTVPPPEFRCSKDYSNFWENLKYFLQTAYMVPPALLYCRILYIVWRKNRKIYGQHQFFVIYSMDSVVGLCLLLLDIFITRFFVYIPQFCESGSRFFENHEFLMNIYYPLLNYLHCCQPLIQIFLCLNRMSSVISPVEHNKIWKKYLISIISFILFTPFLFIWNSIISPKIVVFYFGGFFMIGTKYVEWADISLFLFSIRSFSVLVTVTSTVIMFLRMSKMKKRLKSSEKTLCFACVIHSICFMIPSFFEALAIFNEEYGKSWINFLIQPFAWDVLNVGSPIIMIFVSGQLRRHVFDFSWKKKLPGRKITVQTLTVSVSSQQF